MRHIHGIRWQVAAGLPVIGVLLFMAGCSAEGKGDPRAEAPPPVEVVHVQNAGTFKVDDPSKFPLVTAGERVAAPELNVTGVVSADVSRNIPVVTLATGTFQPARERFGDHSLCQRFHLEGLLGTHRCNVTACALQAGGRESFQFREGRRSAHYS
jgi:hypothetical protein